MNLITGRYPRHIVMATVLATIGLVVLEFNILLYNSILIYPFPGLLFCIPIVISICKIISIQNGNSPRSHWWLWIDVFNLNIDITYTQYVGDKHQNCIFYQGDRHPLEANESYKIIADGMKTGLIFKGVVLKRSSKEDLAAEEKKIYDCIYSIITSHVDAECPMVENIVGM